jgi:hypothetical protein
MVFVFLVRLGYALAKQALYHLSHTSSAFCSGYFTDGCLLNYVSGLTSNHDPLILAS